MTQDELLNKCRAAKARYHAEVGKISQEYFTSNLPFKIGDVIEFKNYVNSGFILVEKIYFINLSDFIENPYEYRPAIRISGSKLNADGSFQHCLSHKMETACSDRDFVRVTSIIPKGN